MTPLDVSYPWGRMIRFPTRSEVRAMLDRPEVARTAIVCATIAFLALLGASVWIIASGHDLYVLTAAVLTPLITFLGLIAKRQKAQEKRLDQVVAQTTPTPPTGS